MILAKEFPVAVAMRELVFNQDLKALECKAHVDAGSVFYWLLANSYEILGIADEAAHGTKRLQTDRLLGKSVYLPPFPLQRKIAAILSAYDDLIENNTRRIRILEEMARALYREWSVHFRFPGHEKVGMVESVLGPIPAGWALRKVPEAVHINPRTPVPKDTQNPYVAMNGLSNDSMLISITEYRTGNSGAKYRNDDTLFARITPCLENGKTGFVQFLPSADAVGIGSTEFIVFRSRTLCPEFVYLLARTDAFRGNAIKSMSGASGRQRVQEQ
jgi:type I restriction enzyme S subunit